MPADQIKRRRGMAVCAVSNVIPAVDVLRVFIETCGGGKWWLVRDYGDGWTMAEGFVWEAL